MKAIGIKLQSKDKTKVSKKDLEKIVKKDLKVKTLSHKIITDSKVKRKFRDIELKHSGGVYHIYLNGKPKISTKINDFEEVKEQVENPSEISITLDGIKIVGENAEEVKKLVELLPNIIKPLIKGAFVVGGAGLLGYWIYLKIKRRNNDN